MSTARLTSKLPHLSLTLLLVASAFALPARADRSLGTGAESAQFSGSGTMNPGGGGTITAPEPNNFPNAGSSAGGTFGSQSESGANSLGGSQSMNTYWSLGVTPRAIINARAEQEADRKRAEQAFVAPPKVTWTQFKGRRNGSVQANSCLMRKQQGVWEVISDPIMDKYPDPDSSQAQAYKRRVFGLPPLPSAGGGGQSIIPQIKRQAPTQAAPQPGSTSGSAIKG